MRYGLVPRGMVLVPQCGLLGLNQLPSSLKAKPRLCCDNSYFTSLKMTFEELK
jgi:hypothetical protein